MRIKIVLLFACATLFFGCKKDTVKDVTAYNWVLQTATRTPGKMFNGKIQTDYLETDPSTCLKNNFSIVFSTNGSHSYTSSGPLCDMTANDGSLKWVQNEADVTLSNTNDNNAKIKARLSGDWLSYTTTLNDNGTNYTIDWKFKAKSK